MEFLETEGGMRYSREWRRESTRRNLRMKWKKGWGKVDDEISSLVGASGMEEERGREGFANGERTFRSIGGRDDEESCGGVRFQVSCT